MGLDAEPRGAEGETVDLAMWRRILALSDNTIQPVIRNDLAVLVSLAESLAAEVARLERVVEKARTFADAVDDYDRAIVADTSADEWDSVTTAMAECERDLREELAALGTKEAGDGD